MQHHKPYLWLGFSNNIYRLSIIVESDVSINLNTPTNVGTSGNRLILSYLISFSNPGQIVSEKQRTLDAFSGNQFNPAVHSKVTVIIKTASVTLGMNTVLIAEADPNNNVKPHSWLELNMESASLLHLVVNRPAGYADNGISNPAESGNRNIINYNVIENAAEPAGQSETYFDLGMVDPSVTDFVTAVAKDNNSNTLGKTTADTSEADSSGGGMDIMRRFS